MGRIRVLSDVVANKIAAGEVVERPASVVKELLENSLDAGSTRIRVETEAGGRRLIRITDDGCGMLRDDALLAFERHATSKLSDVKDLLSIATLGFRGEALPSIGSVSRLTLETRSQDESTGTRVEIQGGKLQRCDEAALAGGTIITVRDLFFNVPARKKFLRSDQTELAHIASLVTHYALAYPGIGFELTHEGRELIAVTPVAELRERVFQVFGTNVLTDLIDLGERTREAPADEESEPNQFTLRGFISPPQIQKLNRNSIYLFVNGRLIKDRLLLHALHAGYQNLMPPSAYPFALLFLNCSYEEVDVNVHPSKTEVRFRRGTFVHDFVRDAVRDVLLAGRPVSNAPLGSFTSPPQVGARLPYSEFTQQIDNVPVPGDLSEPVRMEAGGGPLAGMGAPGMEEAGGLMPDFRLYQPQTPLAQRLDLSAGPPLQVDPHLPVTASGKLRRVPDTHGPLPPGLAVDPQMSLDVLRDLQPMGQLHDSFIIAAGRDGLWVIDQHVAHERILFEQVLRQMAAGEVERQQLLIPLVLELTPAQATEFDRIREELEQSGFDAEPYGPRAVAIKAAPAALGTAEVERVVLEILEISEKELRQSSFEELRNEMAATIACRAAIKINMRLDATRMEWMLRTLAECEFPMSCPHGRPIALRYATREILRGFHRI